MVYSWNNWTFFKWEPDASVFGEVAGLADDDVLLDLVVTYAADKTFHWEVIDETTIIAHGIAQTAAEARHAAETAARRALIRIA